MLIDIVIVVMFLLGAFTGWQSGFFKQLVSLGGFAVGLLVAALCYAKFGESLAPHLGTSMTITNIIAFLLLWVVVPIFLGFLANRLTDAVKLMKLGGINSLLGALVGIGKYMILLSSIFNVMWLLRMVSQEKREASYLFAPVKALLGSYFGDDENDATFVMNQEERGSSDTVWIDLDKLRKNAVADSTKTE